VKSCVIYLTKNFACLLNCRCCADRAQNLPRPASNNVLRALQHIRDDTCYNGRVFPLVAGFREEFCRDVRVRRLDELGVGVEGKMLQVVVKIGVGPGEETMASRPEKSVLASDSATANAGLERERQGGESRRPASPRTLSERIGGRIRTGLVSSFSGVPGIDFNEFGPGSVEGIAASLAT